MSRAIITAASKGYGRSLLALLGSLNLNWPNHPKVRVYDIGLDQNTLDILHTNSIDIVSVPPFCNHWRKHFTWKIWCLNHAPEKDILWIDAGVAILRPLDEIFTFLSLQNYFVVPNYQLLDYEASKATCTGCGVHPNFRFGKLTLAGTLMAFRKEGIIKQVLNEALAISYNEKYIKATTATHRHDQAIISLLLYKYFNHVLFSDGIIYLGWKSPYQCKGQKVWVHRRKMLESDLVHFCSHISSSGAPYLPQDPAFIHISGPFYLKAYKTLRYRYVRRLWAVARAIVLKKHSATVRSETPYDGVRD